MQELQDSLESDNEVADLHLLPTLRCPKLQLLVKLQQLFTPSCTSVCGASRVAVRIYDFLSQGGWTLSIPLTAGAGGSSLVLATSINSVTV